MMFLDLEISSVISGEICLSHLYKKISNHDVFRFNLLPIPIADTSNY
jgi:hypothetical protein